MNAFTQSINFDAVNIAVLAEETDLVSIDFRFGKEYKLCRKKIIEQLFKPETKQIWNFPFRIKYLITALPTEKTFQILIAVPKRKFKRAHDRNRIKRQMREGIRHNKLILEKFLTEKGVQLAVLFNFNHDQELETMDVDSKIKKSIQKLIEQIKDVKQ